MRSKITFLAAAVLQGLLSVAMSAEAPAATQPQHWQTPAQWHRLLKKAVRGTLLLDDEGVEFRSAKSSQRWAYVEIYSFNLSAKELTLTGYQNRPWHEPGEVTFHFTWSEPMPAEIAALFADRVQKPVRNGIPFPSVAAVSEIPAHHRMWSGGSNGTLRLKDSGIDYVTENGRDSRTWPWTDIQTIANPNPYEFRVAGFREVVEFDLKQPMPRHLFELMWDHLYSADLDLSAAGGGEHR